MWANNASFFDQHVYVDIAHPLLRLSFVEDTASSTGSPSPSDFSERRPPHNLFSPGPNTTADEYMSNSTFSSLHSTPRSQLSFAYPPQSVLVDGQQTEASNWLLSGGNQYSNHPPTPTQTPVHDSYLSPTRSLHYTQQFSPFDRAMAIKSIYGDAPSVAAEDSPGFSQSARHSVSSRGRNSPSTPRTVNDDDSALDDHLQVSSADTITRPTINVPTHDRTMADMYAEGVDYPAPHPIIIPHRQQIKGNTLLSPFCTNALMNQRIQQANVARSMSPSVNNSSRGASPYRETFGFDYVQDGRRPGQDAMMVRRAAQDSEEPKTISPKDAFREYTPTEQDNKTGPLFPVSDATFGSYVQNGSRSYESGADATSSSRRFSGVGEISGWPGQNSANAAAAPFGFAPASVPGLFHGMEFAQNMAAAASEETPEFPVPAQLIRMESSASDAPPLSSANSYQEAPRPAASTLADSGTYTCTYHGCTVRSETPQKLQRHRRDAHNNSNSAATLSAAPTVMPSATPTNTPVTPGVGSGMTSAALLVRNSQAGPHKCERMNPTTGKHCNTIFSRPYDLTRHEDTIHNIRKTKVRCTLCLEVKTFSRSDALTRHMRIVHPDVDFPGKYRRRGGRGEED